MDNCIFCRIAEKDLTADIVWEDDMSIAFTDMHPQAPAHFLVIPRKHLVSLASAGTEDRDLLGHLLVVCGQVAHRLGFGSDFRVVINTGAGAGQSVFHLHIHVLAGRDFGWPPG